MTQTVTNGKNTRPTYEKPLHRAGYCVLDLSLPQDDPNGILFQSDTKYHVITQAGMQSRKGKSVDVYAWNKYENDFVPLSEMEQHEDWRETLANRPSKHQVDVNHRIDEQGARLFSDLMVICKNASSALKKGTLTDDAKSALIDALTKGITHLES